MKIHKSIGAIVAVIVMSVHFTSCKYDDNELKESFDQLENRIAILETLCKQNNENIVSLQTIVNVLKTGDYITGVTAITNDEVEIGYKIIFAKAGTITIYHGEKGADGTDGVDGADGMDGADGHAPIVGVKQDLDGVYYWTIDGEFIVVDGQKMNVQGKDGKDGEDGKDGADGKDGEDGKDGVDGTNGSNGKNGKDGLTPQFKIENGYWYISYNGTSWTNVGKAMGEDGTNNCIFSSISEDSEKVYFTLADGTIIIVSKESKINDDTLLLPDGPTFNSIVGTFLENNTNLTKIKFIANSDVTSQSILVTDPDGTIGYMVANGEWLEIHTLGKEFVANGACSGMFSANNGEIAFKIIENIEFNDCFDTSNSNRMDWMFAGCESLTSLDVSLFNTSKVTNMKLMFTDCQKLTMLDVSGFDTSNVTDMGWMFLRCHNLSSLDVSEFNTSNVIDMSNMFVDCKNLNSLDLTNFSFIKTPLVNGMFSGLGNDVSLKPAIVKVSEEGYKYMTQTSMDCEIGNFTSKFVKSDGSDFENLLPYYLPNGRIFNLEMDRILEGNTKVNKMKFVANSNITSDKIIYANITGTKGYIVINGEYIEIHTPASKFIANDDCQGMFCGYKIVDYLPYPPTPFSWFTNIEFGENFDTSNVTNMGSMFSDCEKLENLNIDAFDTSNVVYMGAMFQLCRSLKSLNVSGFKTQNVESMNFMFSSCNNLTSLDLSNFSTTNVKDMSYMFQGCRKLELLDLKSFSFSEMPSVRSMLVYVGESSDNKPIPIKVTEAGHEYLTETTTDCGIGTTAKFVKPDGTDW